MMDRNAIDKIEELVTLRLTDATVYGIPYDRKTWKPIEEPAHETLQVRTLQAFADYVLHELPDAATWVVHVANPARVRLVSGTDNPTRKRGVLIAADAILPDATKFNARMSQEEFSIWLQTTFVQTAALEELLKISGNVKAEAIATSRDDGVTQQATVHKGVASVERADVPPKWELSAWRTFSEVTQPSGWYLFRIGQDLGMSLHPVIDASWSLKAMKEIKAFLDERLPGYTVLA